jgi:SAM-dependent methyltransferase
VTSPLSADYDEIGGGYTSTRTTDPRLAAAIWGALGDAQSVLNVGAGAGAYEPPGRELIALEPSEVMIAQRPAGAAPVMRGRAEAIPLRDDSVDVAMSVLSDHHWRDRRAGMTEMRRVARKRVVIFNQNPALWPLYWFSEEYLPGFKDLIPTGYREPGAWERELRLVLGEISIEAVPIPHDCQDGFYGAWWRRPQAFLDPRVRAGISVFSRVSAEEVERGIARLRSDLDSGAWAERHADLLELDELDLGYRVVVARMA